MVLEGTSEDVLKSDTVNRMRIRGISEARLFKRNKLEMVVAEKFATIFALNEEQIYRASFFLPTFIPKQRVNYNNIQLYID
jgi:hypothetical protein